MIHIFWYIDIAWWRHQMETFSASLALCAGNSPVTGEFPSQRPVTRSFDVFFDLRLNKRLSKQSRGWWFESHHGHYDVIVIASLMYDDMYYVSHLAKHTVSYLFVLLFIYTTNQKHDFIPKWSISPWLSISWLSIDACIWSVLQLFSNTVVAAITYYSTRRKFMSDWPWNSFRHGKCYMSNKQLWERFIQLYRTRWDKHITSYVWYQYVDNCNNYDRTSPF